MSKFWNMTRPDEGVGSITMYGDISDVSWFGDEITPKQFKDDLDALGDISELEINLNSGGGDVFAGYTIYNILKRHKAKKTVYIDGLAASIASLIAMAGDEIIMPPNSMMMIHNAWTMVAGNKEELRHMADELDKVDGLLVDTYAQRTGLDRDEIADMMANETWLTGTEAVEKGFATQLENGTLVAASLDKKYLDRYQHVPEDITNPDRVLCTISNGKITIPQGYVTLNSANIVNDTIPNWVVSVEGTCIDNNLNKRGESEPLEEITPPAEEQAIADPLVEQQKDFNRIRRKIYERNEE